MDRYLERELDADEAHWLEVYILDRPHLVKELQADEALRAVLAEAELRPAAVSVPVRKRWLRPTPVHLAQAAALALAFVLGAWTLGGGPELAWTAPERVFIDASRSVAAGRPEQLPVHADLTLVDIAGPVGSTAARLWLLDQGGAKEVARLSPDASGVYSIFLPRAARGGRYRLEFDGNAKAFEFSVEDQGR
jgi:hypothetical protein